MIDLHRHLEAAPRIDDLSHFVIKHNIDLPRDADSLRRALTFEGRPGDLASFLEPFTRYIHRCFTSVESVRDFTLLAIKRMNEEGISYGELRLSPFYMSGVYSGSIRVPADDIVKAVLDARDEAAAIWPLRVGIILIVGRELDLSFAHQVVDLALKYQSQVCGVDLAGDESNYPPELFVDAFARAREAGIPITIHAGEAGPAENVRTAVEKLGATRIGHGLAIAKDPEVLAMVRDKGIVLETCPRSNWLTGAVQGSPLDHPLMKLHRAGVKVTVNTDDPMLQDTWLADDIAAARELGASEEDLAAFEKTALMAAFDRTLGRRE